MGLRYVQQVRRFWRGCVGGVDGAHQGCEWGRGHNQHMHNKPAAMVGSGSIECVTLIHDALGECGVLYGT